MYVHGVSVGNLKAIIYWLFTEREPTSVTGICTTPPATCPGLLLHNR